MDKKEINILVVEDSPSDAGLLHEKIREFKTMSCKTTGAACMKDVESMLEKDTYDAIFLDLNLPDSSGIDTVKRINDKRKNTPVIIMTGNSDQELILKTLNLGVQNYIIKGEETPASLERAIIYSIEREKNIQEIQKSKRMISEMVNNAPVMMFALNSEGRTTQVNLEAEKFGSQKTENLLGKPKGAIFDCVNSFKSIDGCGHSRECEGCPLTAVIKEVFVTGNSVRRKEIKYTVLRNGKPAEKFLLVSAEKIGVNGDSNVLVSMEDLTDIRIAEQKVKESEQKFSGAFYSSPVGTMVTRFSDGKIIECNTALERRFGFTHGEIIGRTTVELGLWTSMEERKKIIEKTAGGTPVSGIEVSFRSKKGERVLCLYSAALVEMNGEKCVISTLVDISQQRKIEAELKENEKKFRSLFEQAAVGMAFVSNDGRFISVNSRFCEITGYTKEEMEKMKFKDISYPGTMEKDLQAVKDMIEGKKSVYKTEKQYVRKNGSLIWINLTVAPVRNRDNIFKYFVAVYEDISARKQAEEIWKAFSDSAADTFLLWDKNLNFITANAAAERVFEELSGKKLEAGKPMLELLPFLKDARHFEEFVKVVKEGHVYSIKEHVVNVPRFEPRYFSLKAFKVGDGMGLTAVDITELKRSEIILKRSFEKLKDVDRLKSNFISIVSHELRTPLTIIKGFTSFLIKEAAGPLNDTQKNFANTIDINTARLARIINDMVDMSRIESGTFSIEKERKELISIVNEAVHGMTHIMEEKDISLETIIEVKSAPAEVDKGRIIQTVMNLINNAMRFSKKGGVIRVGLKQADSADIPEAVAGKMNEERNYYYISVCDDGEGMEKKYLEKIFERFYQVENANVRKHQGAGLGLSIAKNIVEAHNGFIWAESEGIGMGSKICILLPE